jgi:phytanoyl-CoA hydroxylase
VSKFVQNKAIWEPMADVTEIIARQMTRPASQDVVRELTEDQWESFARDGFLHLGRVLDDENIARLVQRADDLALGRIVNEKIEMQLDTGGAYTDLPDAVSAFETGTRLYRKIQGLEFDAEFVPLIEHPRFIEACARMYGPHVALSLFRAMIMNKPAGQGTELPWHQDGGDVWGIDREPLVTIWTALDPATEANGCMQAVRGSHRLGLLTNYGSTLSDDHARRHCTPEKVVSLEVPAGHAVLMHNWLIHRSGINPSPVPRRAVTICYLDGRTRWTENGQLLNIVAGSVEASPTAYVQRLLTESAGLRTWALTSEEYALNLERERDILRTQLREQADALALARQAPVETPAPASRGLVDRVFRRARRMMRLISSRRT